MRYIATTGVGLLKGSQPIHIKAATPRVAFDKLLDQMVTREDELSSNVEDITSNNGVWQFGPMLIFTLH